MAPTILTKHQPNREQYWSEVEHFFGNLPPRLLQHGLLLKNTLAAFSSDTGLWQEILCCDNDYPLLSFHFWLLDDWQLPDDETRVQLEKHIFLGMFYSFAATYLRESILDNDSPFDKPHLFLADYISQQSIFHFAQLFPQDSPFWNYYHACWHDYAEVMLWQLQEAHKLNPADFEKPLAAKLSPAKIPVIAVALKTGRVGILPQLLTMMDNLNLIFQIRQDITSIRRDIFRGHATYPIVRTMTKAGLTWPIVPEKVLGAIIFSGSIKQIGQESLGYLEQCRTTAQTLKLPSWLTYFEVVEEITRDTIDLFSFKIPTVATHKKEESTRPPMPFRPYRDNLARGIKMAEDYLLADLTFRESWEVQRYGLLNVPEATSKAFPSGTIIEILSANGHNLSTQVDDFFELLHRSNFIYHENLQTGAPDADDIALALRLYRYSPQPTLQRHRLERPLRWLESNILPSGEIPIFWTKDVEVYISEGFAMPCNSCIGTEINLLLGLIDYDWIKYQPIIENSALNLFERFSKRGWSGMSYYETLYILWVLFRLIDQLSAHPINPTLQEKMKHIRPLLLRQVAQEIKQPCLTPQNLALLTLTCVSQPAELHVKPEWINTLLKQQRYDGSWDDEPFFATPHRDAIGMWYSSRPITTAFCYHALKSVA